MRDASDSLPCTAAGRRNTTRLFFSGVLVLTVTNLIVKAIGLMFKIPMNYIVGDEGMGYYNSAYTIYTYLYMVSTAGLPTAISIMVADSRAGGRILQVKRTFRTAMLLFFVIGCIGMAAMLFDSGAMSGAIGAPDTRLCIMAIAPTLFFICISSALRGYFQGYQQMLPVAVSQLIEALCKLLVGVGFAVYAVRQNMPVYAVAAYATVGLTVGAGLGMLYLLIAKMFFRSKEYDMGVVRCDDAVPAGAILKKLVIIALPITVSASVMSLTNLIDAALVQRLLQGAGVARTAATELYGNYTSLAVPMFNLPPVLIYPIAYSIVPLITAAKKRGDASKCKIVAESSVRVAMLVGVPCGLGLAALAEPVLGLFYVESSVSLAAPLLTLLAPSSAFVCVLAVTNAILQANGFERKPIVSMLVGAAVKITANMLLIGTIGMKATPVSTFLCYLCVTVLNLHFVHKYVGVLPTLSSLFVKPLVSGTACGATARFLYNLLSQELPQNVSTLVSIIVAMAVYLIMIFLVGGVSGDDIKLLPGGRKIHSGLCRLRLIK